MQSDESPPPPLNEKLGNSTACYFMKENCSGEHQVILTEKREKNPCVCTTATYSLARTSDPGQKHFKMIISSKEEKSVNIHDYKKVLFFLQKNILKKKITHKIANLKNAINEHIL